MNIRATLLGIVAVVLWLFPATPRMGPDAALGLLIVLVWLNRTRFGFRQRLASGLFGLVIMTAPGTALALLDDTLMVMAGLLFILPLNRRGVQFSVPVILIAIVLRSAEVFLAASAGVALWRNRIQLRTVWLGGIAVVTLTTHFTVWMLLRDEPFAQGVEASGSHWIVAGLLDGGDRRVLLRETWRALQSGSPEAAATAEDLLSQIERQTGRTDATWALLILSHDAVGRVNEARAFFAEAATRNRGVLDSLSVWETELPHWLPWALFVHDNERYRCEIPGEELDRYTLDQNTAEYLSRGLAAAGLVAQACTLSADNRWRNSSWSRYLDWQSTAALLPTDAGCIVGRGSIVLQPGGRYAFMRAQPARGVWPRISSRHDSEEEEFVLESEFWSLVDLGTADSCTLHLVNDLRSHMEDRNFVIHGRVDYHESRFDSSAVVLRPFLQRIWQRMVRWQEVAPMDLAFARADSGRLIAPTEWNEAFKEPSGWLLPGQSWLLWRNLSRGTYSLVMRGEPALGLWPMAEVMIDDTRKRWLVDGWDWIEYSLEIKTESTEVLLRYANDYWEQETGADRNLWCWGLLPQSIDSEGRDT